MRNGLKKQGCNKYRAIVEALHVAAIVVNINRLIILSNQAFADLVGYSRQAIENRKEWTDFFIKEDLPLARDFIELCQAQNQQISDAFETTVLGFGGKHNPVLISGSRVDENNLGIILVAGKLSVNPAAEQLEKYRLMFDHVRDVVLIVNDDGAIMGANQAAMNAYGYKNAELLSMSLRDLRGGEPHPVLGTRGSTPIFEVAGRRKDGSTFQLEVNACSAEIRGEKITISIGRDISERKLQERKLTEAQKKNQALIDAVPDALFRIGRDGTIKECVGQPRFALSAYDVVGRKVPEILPRYSAQRIMRGVENVLTTKKLVALEHGYPGKNGPQFFESRLAISGEDEVLVIVRNITEHKQMERQLAYMSFHDSLTGLYNRVYFEQEMSRLKSARAGGAGVVVCDVDGLKLINDSLGHDAGDQVLMDIARMIKSAFRAGDMVARIGGDEFAVLLPTQSVQLCINACKRVNRMLANYNNGPFQALPIGISMGYAVSEDANASMEELFKQADNQMYRQKLHHHKSAKSATVEALSQALQIRDYLTEGHGERLENLTVLLARAAVIAESSIQELRLFARFHDIGKIGTPDRILFKPARLTAKEFAVMKQHSEIGCRIAASVPDLAPIADWILMHHEWWNGKGYPTGAEKTKIPVECRILSIADAYDAMTNDRPYRKAVSRRQAVAELLRCAGTQFDPELVRLFVKNT